MAGEGSLYYNKEYKLLIPGYPEGSDITILNTAYFYEQTVEDEDNTGATRRYTAPDFITITFRDNKTGEKKIHKIDNPKYTFYMLKKNITVPDHPLFFASKDDVDPYTCRYSILLKVIAKLTGTEQFYRQNISDGNFKANRRLHTLPELLMSDMNIENYYRFLFSLSYTNNVFKLSKAFLDIETDGRYALSDFPEPGEVPINALAYCDEKSNCTYQFIFDDPRNPALQEYKKRFSKMDVIQELKDFVIQAVGGYKKAVKFGVDKMEYKILFYKDELEMLKAVFDVIEYTSPDFINIWNMAFDLTYIIARIEELGGDPVEIMARQSPHYLKYYIDERNKNNYEERGDFVNISSLTVWNDQMIGFASRRKGRGRYQSFSLNAIGEDVADVKKLDYSYITRDITMLPYIDFKIFSFYNVMDVIVQKCIEKITDDDGYIFTKCLVNNTVYSKCHRQSVYLANRFAKEFYNYGYIIGNNRNLYNEKPSMKFAGAMVGDPLHNNPEVSHHINNRPTMLYDNAVDFDYSSLYPSTILENNMAPNTQYGRIIIEDAENPDRRYSLNEHQDMYSNDDEEAKYSRGGEFLENYMCGNIIEFCRRWAGLGDIYDVENDIREFYSFNMYTGMGIDTTINDAIYFVKGGMSPAILPCRGDYSDNPAIFIFNKLDEEEAKILNEEIKKEAIL